MSKKSFFIQAMGVLALVLILMVIIVFNEPEKGGISRAQAYKAAALVMASREECQLLNEEEESRFTEKERKNWYVPYMDYLYRNGMITDELTAPTARAAQEMITYEEVKYLAKQAGGGLSGEIHLNQNRKNKPYPAEFWTEFLEKLMLVMDTENAVSRLSVILYGTPANIPEAESWTAYTSEGNFRFEGLALDSYIDREIEILVRDDEILTVTKLVSSDVVYKNVWVEDSQEDSLTVHTGFVMKTFEVGEKAGKEENLVHNLADIYLSQGNIEKIVVKKDRISGKVLSVDENQIEIEGYGSVPLTKEFKIYKAYGIFEKQKLSDILVGYDLQEFVTENGSICGALTIREPDAERIRVLLMTDGFKSHFHSSVSMVFQSDVTLSYGKKEKNMKAGESLTIRPGDGLLKEGRLIITPSVSEEAIEITSLNRSLGTPVYSGRIEVKEEADGLLLINELFLEDYLLKVVPSEMPSSYEAEALKAQAVCARTYACRQILGNNYKNYGAHVDDSTNYQVYNNVPYDNKIESAVDQTYGEMLFYGEDAAEIYYYSTSCGTTTDGSVWGGDSSSLPYLEAVELRDKRESITFDTEEEFETFIRDKDYPAYDSDSPMYRWNGNLDVTSMEEKAPEVGTIADVRVTKRGAGGIAEGLLITGDKGKKEIIGQSKIRTFLGSPNLTLTMKNGELRENNGSLPSAFMIIKKEKDRDGKEVFRVYGGGFGHGAGMSQNGAQGMAKEGKTYQEILEFFFMGTELKK